MGAAEESDRKMLGHKVRERRTALGLSISAAAQKAGINRATWSSLERGERQTESYIFGVVERVLKWRSGSIGLILAGSDVDLSELDIDESDQGLMPEPDRLTRDLTAIRDDPKRSLAIRTWAQTLLDQISNIQAADRAEGEEQRVS